MVRAVADTHALLWYLFADSRLSAPARAVTNSATATGNSIAYSSITLAEIIYLSEKGKVGPATLTQVLRVTHAPNSVWVEVPFEVSIAQDMLRIPRSQVPDMPDRIIAATALHLGVPVISRDSKIQLSSVSTIW